MGRVPLKSIVLALIYEDKDVQKRCACGYGGRQSSSGWGAMIYEDFFWEAVGIWRFLEPSFH